jgi:hypothetical protein
MEELTLAIVLMAIASIGVFFVVRRLLRQAPSWLLDTLAVAIVLLIGVYVRFIWGQLWIVRWIPQASVIVLANWFPLFLGALAGVLWGRTQSQTFLRRLPAQLLLITGAIWSEVYVIPRTPPQCGSEWIEPTLLFPIRVCRQTTRYTCSAAAAATILGALGIDTSEAEMAALCLTREGTTWLGLYHGLTVRLRGTGFKVEFFESDIDQLDDIVAEYPALLCCELTDDVDEQFPDYQEMNGWRPGIAHSTVLFACVRNVYIIGDPSQTSPEMWTEEDIRNLWTGRGLRIVRNNE